MGIEATQLRSALSPEQCASKLEAGTGRVWRWLPWLHGVQGREMLFARRRGRRLLISRSGVWRLRQLVAVELEPSADGGSLLTLAPHYDPVLAISSFLLPLAALFALLIPLLHRLLMRNAIDHLGPSLYAFFALALLMMAAGMLKPFPSAHAELDPEVLAFLRRELGTEPLG